MRAIIGKNLRSWLRDGVFGRLGKYEIFLVIGIGLLEPFLMHSGRPIPLVAVTIGAMLSMGCFADAFAGERERGTLDALLLSPASSWRLLLAVWLAGCLYGFALGASIGILGSASAAFAHMRMPGPSTYLVAAVALPLLVATIGGVFCLFSMLAKESRQVVQFGTYALVGGAMLLILGFGRGLDAIAHRALALGVPVLVTMGCAVLIAVAAGGLTASCALLRRARGGAL